MTMYLDLVNSYPSQTISTIDVTESTSGHGIEPELSIRNLQRINLSYKLGKTKKKSIKMEWLIRQVLRNEILTLMVDAWSTYNLVQWSQAQK